MSLVIDVKTELQKQVETMSNGNLTVRYTAKGQPSYFYRFRRSVFEADVEASLSTNHPAFIVGGVQKAEILVGVHQAAEVNGETVSQAGLVPRVDINQDEAVLMTRNTGPGFFVCTTPIYAALALHARATGIFPRGNNNDGRAYNAVDEFGVDKDGDPTGNRGATTIRAGSGPVTWNHPPTPWGVQNLNGNVWERSPGQRTVDGEIQIIADNDAALIGTDLSASGPWQAIDADTGNLVAPGTAGTVKYATSGTTAGTLVCGSGSAFASMTSHGVSDAALTLLKQHGLMQPGLPLESDGFYINLTTERLPIRGGYWNIGSQSGVFALHLSAARSVRGPYLGFRPAFAL